MKVMLLSVIGCTFFSAFGADDIIAKTLYAEARGEGRRGLEWVASVICNRGKGNAEKCVKACLKPFQFSCWNDQSDVVVDRTLKAWAICLRLQKLIETGDFKPLTKAKHYYARSIKTPKWAKGKRSVLVGNHYFVFDVR